MTHIASHIRIFAANPTDDLVAKRTIAIGEIAKAIIGQTGVADVLRNANDLAFAAQQGGSLSPQLTQMVEDAIRKQATAFVADSDTKLEVLVCGMLGELQILTGAKPLRNGSTSIADVLAYGLWSALSFQKPRSEAKLEHLRNELMQTAQNHCAKAASEGRKRVQVADPEFKQPAKKEGSADGEEDTDLDVETVTLGLRPFRTAIADLKANAALDREELDLLWWVLSDWSTLLRRRFSAEGGAVAAVASGIEAGRLIRRIPVDAHRHLVQRNVNAGKDLSLQELLNAIGEDRTALAPTEGQGFIAQCPAVFPLSSALITGKADDAKAKIKRTITDWADRALLESAIAHMCSNLPVVSV